MSGHIDSRIQRFNDAFWTQINSNGKLFFYSQNHLGFIKNGYGSLNCTTHQKRVKNVGNDYKELLLPEGQFALETFAVAKKCLVSSPDGMVILTTDLEWLIDNDENHNWLKDPTLPQPSTTIQIKNHHQIFYR